MIKGFDTATSCGDATIALAKDGGFLFAIRYYATNSKNPKVITPAEAERFLKAGMTLIPVFQDSNNKPGCFSESLGYKNANAAYEYAANEMKQPHGTPIYFAVDYDASEDDTKGRIKDYFSAIRNVFEGKGESYKIGVYGSGLVCEYIKEQTGLADYSWLSMSTKHRKSKEYEQKGTWDIHQKVGITIGRVDCDENEGKAVVGWKI